MKITPFNEKAHTTVPEMLLKLTRVLCQRAVVLEDSVARFKLWPSLQRHQHGKPHNKCMYVCMVALQSESQKKDRGGKS